MFVSDYICLPDSTHPSQHPPVSFLRNFSFGKGPLKCYVAQNLGMSDFLGKSITKVYGSTLLALQGGGIVKFPGKMLCNTWMTPKWDIWCCRMLSRARNTSNRRSSIWWKRWRRFNHCCRRSTRWNKVGIMQIRMQIINMVSSAEITVEALPWEIWCIIIITLLSIQTMEIHFAKGSQSNYTSKLTNQICKY